MAISKAEQSEVLGIRPVGPLLWEFALPGIIAMSATSIYNICDSIFLGQQLGAMAIAGMAITFPLMNISTAFCIIASVGGSVLTSICMGRGDRTKAQGILGNVLLINLTASLLISVLGLTFLDPILRAFGASEATLPYAHQYMQIILLGIVVNHVLQSLLGQLRSTGFPRAAMRIQLVSVVLNIVFDVVFIFGMDWGIRGAALATVLCQVISLLMVLPRFLHKDNYVAITPGIFKLNKSYVREIFGIGISPFLSNICGFVIVMAINLSLVKYGGDLYVGAFGVSNRIIQLLIMIVSGFSQGLQPIVGYNLGANRYDRVREALSLALIIATIITTIGYTLISFFPESLAGLFSRDHELIKVCVPALRISMCTFPIVGSQLIAVSFFQSIHRAKLSVTINLSRQLLVLLPMLCWLPSLIGVTGVWWSMAIADCFSVMLSWYLLKREVKSLKASR